MKEPLLSVHITRQFLNETLLCLLIRYFISRASSVGPRMFSNVVLFINRFLICTKSSMNTGKMKIEVTSLTRNTPSRQNFSRSLVYSYLKTNHFSYRRGFSRRMLSEARVERSPIRPRQMNRKIKKKMNLEMLLFPTQLLIQVQ